MATSTNKSVSRATGENDGTSSEDGSNAGERVLPARKSVSRAVTPVKKTTTAPADTPAMKTPRGAAKTSRFSPAPAHTSTTTPSPLAAPKLSKDELRAQVVKLEGSNAMLKAKSRDMNRTIKAANNRIAELETELAELREEATATQAAAKPAKKKQKLLVPRAHRGKHRSILAMPCPPGVAVEEPQPLHEEARSAPDALAEHLSAG